jgi:hypothetical protein
MFLVLFNPFLNSAVQSLNKLKSRVRLDLFGLKTLHIICYLSLKFIFKFLPNNNFYIFLNQQKQKKVYKKKKEEIVVRTRR